MLNCTGCVAIVPTKTTFQQMKNAKVPKVQSRIIEKKPTKINAPGCDGMRLEQILMQKMLHRNIAITLHLDLLISMPNRLETENICSCAVHNIVLNSHKMLAVSARGFIISSPSIQSNFNE